MTIKINNNDNKINNNDNNSILKVNYSLSSMIIAEIFVFILLGIYLLAIYKNPNEDSCVIVFFAILFFGIFVFIWFRSFKIVIKNGVLKYSLLLGKRKEIPLEEIEEAYIEIGVNSKEDVYKAFMRLVIRPKKYSNIKEFYINLKPFEREGISKLLKILPMRKGKGCRRLDIIKNNKEK
ncbi:MAG TPA: hypothetical protein P5547_13945 [Spirochaetota bacterium]|nr:hypothetical protein [Spirochaetota bacterium]